MDIYIPSIKYAIEYDGEAWHGKETEHKEERKYYLCKKEGIKLIRLRENMPELGHSYADYSFGVENLYEPKNLEKVIAELLRRINLLFKIRIIEYPVDVNIERDRFEIQNFRTKIKKESLLQKYPEIAKEWHPTKNGKLTPDLFKPRSDHKVWWLCSDCGFEYEATIGHRTYGTGCPKCSVEKSTKAKRKPVNMIDPKSGKVLSTFISISDASRKMKTNNSNISMVCKGQRPRAGGYFWAYDKI